CFYCFNASVTSPCSSTVLFFTPPPPSPLYTLSLHDALPISIAELVHCGLFDEHVRKLREEHVRRRDTLIGALERHAPPIRVSRRSEEHTSELQSRGHLVCRLLLEKKKKKQKKKEQKA